MKAALYLRSSKDRSDVSIDAQRRQLQDMAIQRGLMIVKEYADAVESGKDDDRPGFQEMLGDIRNPKRGWEAVLVLDTARIARRRHLAIIFEEHECKRHNIRVIYKSLPDSDPITEMLLKSILQAMDEWHSLTSKAKGLSGMAENVRQGFRAGGAAPKGYKLESVATGAIRDGLPVTKSKLAANEDALLVRAYLQHRARGIPRARALAQINQDWPVTTLLSMERNALTYAGHTVWNRLAEKSEGGNAAGRYRPRSEWIIQRGTHEPLISDEEAESILQLLEGRKHTRARTSARNYLLAGLLQDPDGNKWHGSGDGYYRLGKGKRVSAESVDRAVMECIKADITSDAFASSVLQHYKELSKPIGRDSTLSKLTAKVNELDKQAHKLAELLPETTAQATLLRSIEKIEAERDALQTQIDEHQKSEKLSKAMKALKLSDVKTMLESVADQLGGESSASLKDALASIVEAVILDDSTLEATVAYRIGSATGGKMASPRGVEPRSPP